MNAEVAFKAARDATLRGHAYAAAALENAGMQPSILWWVAPALAGIIVWPLLYQISCTVSCAVCSSYGKLGRADKANWDSRVPSTVHAVAVVWAAVHLLGASTLFVEGGEPGASSANLMLRSSRMSNFWLGVSMGYFIYDLILVLSYFPTLGGWEFLIHHFAALAPMVNGLLKGEVHYYLYMCLLTEATTPFVNLRYWLSKSNASKGAVYKWNGVAMLVSWAITRVALFLYVFWHMFTHRAQLAATSYLARVMVFTIMPTLSVLNWYWFYRIVVGLVKLFSPPKKV